jgi:hypothetical protein
MLASVLLTNIKNSLDDDGVYRTDALLLKWLNDGHRLMAVFTLFDERRASVDIQGNRSLVGLPAVNGAECLAPLYVVQTTTGARIHPATLQEFGFQNAAWEGSVNTSGIGYYTLLSPHAHNFARVAVSTTAGTGSSKYNLIGAFVPKVLISTDEIGVSDEFIGGLGHYVRFSAFVSEPGRGKDAALAYRKFIEVMDRFVVSLKSRFPSGRDYEPRSVEFVYGAVTAQQKKAAPREAEPEAKE